MEIRDPIHGSIELTPDETAVIDNAFFQRLRNIKQLGFTEFSFPGATHNRYCHSLGAMHLAGLAFDHIFQGYPFSNNTVRWRLRQAVRLAALLHDVGHGPLSHTTELVMPQVGELGIKIYGKSEARRANHEDYTIKIVTDSELSKVLKDSFKDLTSQHVAQLIDKTLSSSDDFFTDRDINLRPLLSQLVSSELDVDRMDYLARDSYYCGTSYGKVDSDWLIANLTHYENAGGLYLALNHKALYTFDDFLISRYHMYLMVYFHHKGIVYDEMLHQYLGSKDCDFRLPSDITEYVKFDDYRLHSHMAQSQNRWAKLISQRRPYRMLIESHEQSSKRLDGVKEKLDSAKIEYLYAGSMGRLSKYYGGGYGAGHEHGEAIYVIDRDRSLDNRVTKIEQSTEIFEKYENARKIGRLYVSREDYQRAEEIVRKSLSSHPQTHA